MPRRKSTTAFEVLSVRVPQGLPARINDYAHLHKQRVRDVIITALQTYLDGTQVLPLEAAADALVRAALGHITEAARVLNRVPSSRTRSTTPSGDVPWYDDTKFKLGILCPRGTDHEWNNSGQTIRTIKGSKCRLCENEGKKKRAEAKRAHAA